MKKPPPILFILASQLRSDVLGPYGGHLARTPHLDVLAQHTAVFERHFTPCPQSIPARTSILTGLDPLDHGAIINGWAPRELAYGTMRPNKDLLPMRLVEAGYRVVHVGIQHLRTDPPLTQLMTGVEFVGPVSSSEYHKQLGDRGLMLGDPRATRDPVVDYDSGKTVVFSASSTRTSIFPLREDLFLDRVIAKAAAQVIKEHDDDRPLAVLCHFWLTHPPLCTPRQWAQRHDPATLNLPSTVGVWGRRTPANTLANIPGQLGAHISEPGWREAWAMYLGMTEMLDDCVGEVLRALEKRKWFKPAVIMLSSDHGEMLGNHGLFQKMCMYEQAVRVPMMLKLPGTGGQRRVWDLTNHVDIAATLLEAASGPPIKASQGQSLLSLARGQSQNPPRDAIFATYDGNAGRGFEQRMIRTKTHKLIEHITGEAELFDLIDDPRETRNLLHKGEVEDVHLTLRRQLLNWCEQHGDTMLSRTESLT